MYAAPEGIRVFPIVLTMSRGPSVMHFRTFSKKMMTAVKGGQFFQIMY